MAGGGDPLEPGIELDRGLDRAVAQHRPDHLVAVRVPLQIEIAAQMAELVRAQPAAELAADELA